MTETIEKQDIFIGKARKYNRYIDSGTVNKERSCISCKRKHYSYPWTCDDGWVFYQRKLADEKGSRCLNWCNRDCEID